MLTGFDAPPLHTLYLDRPLKGALLMQTLARVNRTFRGKHDGLLVGVRAAGGEPAARRSPSTPRPTRPNKPVGRNVDEAVALARDADRAARRAAAPATTGERRSCRGDPQSLDQGGRRAHQLPALARDSGQPGRRGRGTARRPRFRKLASQLARAWALAAGDETLADLRADGAVLRGGPGLDGASSTPQERQAHGRAGPRGDPAAAVRPRCIADTPTGEIVDIYEAAGMPKPSLSDLARTSPPRRSRPSNPHLAIEALRDLLTEESAKVDAQQPGPPAGVLRADHAS